MHARCGPGWRWRGASCVSWVLDEAGLVGDNNLDGVTPAGEDEAAVASVLEGRPARMLASRRMAGADRVDPDVSGGRTRPPRPTEALAWVSCRGWRTPRRVPWTAGCGSCGGRACGPRRSRRAFRRSVPSPTGSSPDPGWSHSTRTGLLRTAPTATSLALAETGSRRLGACRTRRRLVHQL